MKFSFNVSTELSLEYSKETSKSKHAGVGVSLSTSSNLDKSNYIDAEEYPTKEGHHVITNVLVQGLINNIHVSHDLGFKDSAEHLRYIVSELERGFIELVNIEKR